VRLVERKCYKGDIPQGCFRFLNRKSSFCVCKTDLCNEAEYSTLLYTRTSSHAISGVMLMIAMIILVIGLIFLHFTVCNHNH